MSEQTNDSILVRWTKDHPGFLLALSGILLSSLGLYHQFLLLDEFDLNLSDYADIDDFLIGAINLFYARRFAELQQLTLLIGATLAYTVAVIVYLIVRRVMNVRAANSSNQVRRFLSTVWTNVVVPLFLINVILSFFIVSELAAAQANAVREESVCRVEVVLRNPADRIGSLQGSKVYLIDGLNSAYFLYEVLTNRLGSRISENVHVVPVANVISIRVIGQSRSCSISS